MSDTYKRTRKDILNLLVRQLGYLRDFGTSVNEVDGKENLRLFEIYRCIR